LLREVFDFREKDHFSLKSIFIPSFYLGWEEWCGQINGIVRIGKSLLCSIFNKIHLSAEMIAEDS
jgi:hypothetical protein